jgi:hypothetical protein
MQIPRLALGMTSENTLKTRKPRSAADWGFSLEKRFRS